MPTLAFTLAEILMIIGIIGIIADMTIPTLMKNYQKATIISQYKKAYSVLSQGTKLSEIENGDSTTWEFPTNQAQVEEYFKIYYKPYFNILKICKTYQECGYKQQTWKYFNGTNGSSLTIVYPPARTTATLVDGSVVVFGGYTYEANPDGDPEQVAMKIHYDLNGSNGPNTYGKDVFLFENTTKGIMPYGHTHTDRDIMQDCSRIGHMCGAKIVRDGYQINYW